MQQSEYADDFVRNVLIIISYDGKNYHGWQIQNNAISVQEVFQNALQKVLGEYVDIKGCSRTDAGVHANMYCISTKIKSRISCKNLIFALNRHLPYDICVKECFDVSYDFHARYSCIGKEYIYKIWNSRIRNPFLHGYALHYWYPLDIQKMEVASKFYIGAHDFTSFCTIDKRKMLNMVRVVKHFEITKSSEMIELKVAANGFLYNMVRIMVGTLLRVCQGKIDVYDIPHILESKDRAQAGPTAPACGLYLNRVFY